MSDLPSPVAVVANSSPSLYRFRAPLLRQLVESGSAVYAVAPEGSFKDQFESLGVEFVPWRLDRSSVNPVAELASVVDLVRIYRRVRPALVQHFTVKANLYGALAARIAGVQLVIGGVTGLGYAFMPGGTSRAILRSGIVPAYRFCSLLSDRIMFQNRDDVVPILGRARLFARKAVVVPGGSGVDLGVFSLGVVSDRERVKLRKKLEINCGTLVVTMASRLLYDKGVREYSKAAQLLRDRWPNVTFILAGEPDPGNRDSISDRDLVRLTEECNVYPVGYVAEMPALLSISDVIVLPSYGEGVPRVLMEAAAMEKPICCLPISQVSGRSSNTV